MSGNAQTKAQLRVASEQRMASREMLLTPHTRRTTVLIESLGAHVTLRSMTFAERETLQAETGFGTESFDQQRYTLMCLVTCIEEPSVTEKDLEALAKQEMRVIDELALQVSFINLSGGDAEEAKKDSPKTQTSDSDSSSPNA